MFLTILIKQKFVGKHIVFLNILLFLLLFFSFSFLVKNKLLQFLCVFHPQQFNSCDICCVFLCNIFCCLFFCYTFFCLPIRTTTPREKKMFRKKKRKEIHGWMMEKFIDGFRSNSNRWQIKYNVTARKREIFFENCRNIRIIFFDNL